MNKYITLNADGYFVFNNEVVTDVPIGGGLLTNLKSLPNGGFTTTLNKIDAFVEAYDHPLVIQDVSPLEEFSFSLTAAYEFSFIFDCRKFYVDEWDRFCGTTNNIPFVLSLSLIHI